MEDELRDLGLSKNETKVYIALSEIGLTTIGEVSKNTKIHRANVYDAVESLKSKGLISYILKEKTKYFQVSDPENLLTMIREKEDKAMQIIPKLKLLRDLAQSESYAQIMEGLPAAKRVMDHFLTHKDTILVMGVSSDVSDLIGPFLSNFHKRRIDQKIKMRHIYNSDAHKRISYLKKLSLTEVRILPGEYDSPVATNIVGDEVILIHWSKNPLITIIKSRKIADSYRKYFEILWKDAKPA